MNADLSTLLFKAREYTGPNGPRTMAPGVTDAEAHVAAWHACIVQGGTSSPEREALRLAADRGTLDRRVSDAEQACLTNESPLNMELVLAIIGTDLATEAAVAAVRALPKAPAQQGAKYLPPEGRGEWVASDGKQYHRTAAGDEHVGNWLTCDACNPIAVVKASNNAGQADELYDLRAEYYAAKQAKDAAEERFKAVQGMLKTVLSEATNEALRSALHVPGYRPLTLTYGERWTIDSKALKAEQPVTYAMYAKLGSSWTLGESKGPVTS